MLVVNIIFIPHLIYGIYYDPIPTIIEIVFKKIFFILVLIILKLNLNENSEN